MAVPAMAQSAIQYLATVAHGPVPFSAVAAVHALTLGTSECSNADRVAVTTLFRSDGAARRQAHKPDNGSSWTPQDLPFPGRAGPGIWRPRRRPWPTT